MIWGTGDTEPPILSQDQRQDEANRCTLNLAEQGVSVLLDATESLGFRDTRLYPWARWPVSTEG